jgi:predicted O-methyltransferase YrrM
MSGYYLVKPQQHLEELADFIAFLKGKKIKSYLEIGCKFGGWLWAVVQQAMPPKIRVVGVDLPNGPWGRSESLASLNECFAHLSRQGHDAHLFIGDSTNKSVVEKVKALSPFDVIFIDANHTEAYVTKDFSSYGRMGNIICFHDIGWDNPTPPGRMAIDVPKVWRGLKETYKDQASFSEIKRDKRHNGIGILQWH